jgi:flavin-dependent dehydrogenase
MESAYLYLAMEIEGLYRLAEFKSRKKKRAYYNKNSVINLCEGEKGLSISMNLEQQPEKLYDAIIVGAGPGGASSAYFLSQAGKSILVLERTKLPRYKACGGGVSLKMLAKYFPFSFEPVIAAHPQSVGYTLYGDTVNVRLPKEWLGMVMRSEFDAFILQHANVELNEGATVTKVTEMADRVKVETKEGQVFQGRYIIGADGVNSQVAKSLGLRRKTKPVPAIEAEVRVSQGMLKQFKQQPLFIFSIVRRGYLDIPEK